MVYLELFLSFMKIGVLGFGGGMAIIGLIQNEVEQHAWMSETEFVDVVAISQMTPGPIGINCATYTGYTACKEAGLSDWMAVLGSTTATMAIILPSLVIMLILSAIYFKIQGRWAENKYYQWTMLAIRLLVLGLIAQAAYSMLTPASMIDSASWAIFGIVAGLTLLPMVYKNRVTQRLSHPILLIILAGIAGWLLY